MSVIEPQPRADIRARDATGAAARPEHELLIYSARVCMEAETADGMKALLRKDIDWDYLLQHALQHGMMPLLYWHLQEHCPGLVPEPTLSQFREHFLGNTGKNLF